MIIDIHQISQLLIPIAHAAEEAANTESSGGALATLGVNWKLFIAQLVNFGIILAVLWKFVFIPVAKQLTERTEKIEKSLSDADRITKEKDEFTKWREAEISKTKAQAATIVAAAESEANKAKQQIAEQTKQEQDKIIRQAKDLIESEKQKAVRDIKSEVAEMVTAATEKILRQKLDNKTDKELIKESLKSI